MYDNKYIYIYIEYGTLTGMAGINDWKDEAWLTRLGTHLGM